MRELLETTYSEHRQSLFTLALSITRCRQQAEDAVHSAFERLCRRSGTPDGDVTGYVFATVRNTARDLVRTDRRIHSKYESIFNGKSQSLSTSDADERVLTEERDELLRNAIDELSVDEREVVVLKTFSSLTFDDIGGILGMPPKTVATRYRRALIRLEEKLKGRL